MALIKTKITRYGVPCSYWRIGYISIDKNERYGNVSVNLFYDKNATQPMDYYTEVIDTKEKWDNYFSATALSHYKDIYEAGYDFILAYSEYFKDAVVEEETEDGVVFTNPKFVTPSEPEGEEPEGEIIEGNEEENKEPIKEEEPIIEEPIKPEEELEEELEGEPEGEEEPIE